MTKAEFTKWGLALITYYPNGQALATKEAVDLWYERLRDIQADVAMSMLNKWSETEKWPPTIADVRKICSEMTAGKPADWGSAWEEVTRAIRKYVYSEQEKALDSMSPLTQNAVEKLGWRAICLSENPDTIRAQFRQVYEICSKREAEDRQISPQLKAMISNLLDERNSALLEDGSRSMIGEGAP